jgi:hypothetical protein
MNNSKQRMESNLIHSVSCLNFDLRTTVDVEGQGSLNGNSEPEHALT